MTWRVSIDGQILPRPLVETELKRFVTKKSPVPPEVTYASDEASVIQPQEGENRGPNEIARRSRAISSISILNA